MCMSKEDMNYLLNIGCLEEDLGQIAYAAKANVTKYECGGKRIAKAQAIELLGREKWLSGLARSAFHWSAVRENEEGVSSFDSSKIWKENKA